MGAVDPFSKRIGLRRPHIFKENRAILCDPIAHAISFSIPIEFWPGTAQNKCVCPNIASRVSAERRDTLRREGLALRALQTTFPLY
jgi:hypothetical protein